MAVTMALLRPTLPCSRPSLSFLRSFSGTSHCASKSSAKRLIDLHSAVPTYPYGPSAWYKQSNFGLYGLQKIRFGNIVSEKNEVKTRRYWRPNVQRKRLWSVALNRYLKLRITARVLRTVDKCGGLDEYLLGEKAGRIKELGMGGWKLRWRIMQTESVKERFRSQRITMGLQPMDEVQLGSDGKVATEAQVAEEIRAYDEEIAREAEIGVGEDLVEDERGFMEEDIDRSAKITV